MEISTLALSSSFSSYPQSFASSRSSIFNPNFITSTNLKQTKGSAALALNPVKRRSLSCTCLFGLGVPELVVIGGVAALLFGPKQLPEVGRSIGKTIKSFQQAAKEFETELKKEPDTITEPPPRSPTPAASNREVEKQDAMASSSKENS